IPVGDWEKTHGEMFRLWSDLRKDALILEHRTCDVKCDAHVDPYCAERLAELVSKTESFHAQEPLAYKSLLDECKEDENEANTGFRKDEEKKRKRERILKEQPKITFFFSSPSPGGPAQWALMACETFVPRL